MFQMCGVFAEFEKGMLSERVKAGLNRAKEEGKVLGRPIKIADIKAIQEARRVVKTIRDIANQEKLSIGKIHKVLKGVIRNVCQIYEINHCIPVLFCS